MLRRLRKLPWIIRHRYIAGFASRMRKYGIQLTHLHCHVEFQGPVRISKGFRLRIPDNGTLVVGPGVDFRGPFVCEISGDGRITIGGGVIFTGDALVQCTTTMDIGDRAIFGQGVMLADGSHRFRDYTKHLLEQGYDFSPLHIGANAIITSKCTLIADVGNNAFIGANSFVNRPVPAYCFAGGVPAKVIEYFGPPDQRPESLSQTPSASS